MNIFESFDWKELASAFVVLFAIIDIVGAIPIIINLQRNKGGFHPEKAIAYSGFIMVSFLFAGEAILKLFGVDLNSFAIAGGMVIFVMALEMILGVEIMKNDSPSRKGSTLVPLVFPLIAGTGAFTTLLSLRAEYAQINVILALILNLGVVYLVLKKVSVFERILGDGGIFILKKIFGVILLAISVKLFLSNVMMLIEQAQR